MESYRAQPKSPVEIKGKFYDEQIINGTKVLVEVQPPAVSPVIAQPMYEQSMGHTQAIEQITLAREGLETLGAKMDAQLLEAQQAKAKQDEELSQQRKIRALQSFMAQQGQVAHQAPVQTNQQSDLIDRKPTSGVNQFELINAAEAKNISTEDFPAFEREFKRNKAAEKLARDTARRQQQIQPVVPALAPRQPDVGPSIMDVADDLGLSENRMPIVGEKNPLIYQPSKGLNKLDKKKGFVARRPKSMVLGSLALAGVTALGVNSIVSGGGDTNANASNQADVVVTQQDKDILSQMKPAMTADKLKLGLCLDEGTLVSGVVSGQAVTVPLYKGVDGKEKGVGSKNADGSIDSVQVTVEAAPVSVAACAPEELRAAIATMADGVVTINRKDITPQVMLGAGEVTIPDVDIPADSAKGLNEETAKKLEESLANDDIRKDLATLAQVQISESIVSKDGALRTSTLAYVDAYTKVNVRKQITNYYTALNQEVPEVAIEFIGEYADLVASKPKTIAEVEKRTESFKVIGGQVVKLSFPDTPQESKK